MNQQINFLDLDTPIEVLMGAEIAALQMMRPAMIAIDGPAGAGKSTIGHQLAQILDFLFFDTGIMYRAVTHMALERQLDLTNPQEMGQLAHAITIDVTPIDETAETALAVGTYCYVHVDGVDITPHLRTTEVDRNVSVVSAHPLVRRALSEQQRRIGHQFGAGKSRLAVGTGDSVLGDSVLGDSVLGDSVLGDSVLGDSVPGGSSINDPGVNEKQGIVMVGRDIGTVVLPDAPLKIFMVASLIERARRRFCEQRKKGKPVTLSQTVDEIERRDRIDSERDLSPMRCAIDAIELDTSEMAAEEVLQAILSVANDLSVIQ